MAKIKKDGEKMTSFTMRLKPSLLERAKEKAGYIPLSVILRLLLEKWIKGEVNIDLTK